MQRCRASFIALAGSAVAIVTLVACSLTASLDGFASTIVYADDAADGTASGTDGQARADGDGLGPDAWSACAEATLASWIATASGSCRPALPSLSRQCSFNAL